MNIIYRSELACTGYGLAALAYVRHLKAAGQGLGARVHWQPFFVDRSRAGQARVLPPEQTYGHLLAFARRFADDEQWQDLETLLRQNARPVQPDLTVMHAMPELWGSLRSAHGRHVGYLTWEADAWPKAWEPFAAQVDGVMVPSQFNAQAMQKSAAWSGLPVHVVPHVHRPVSSRAHEAVPAVRQHLKLPEGTTVFYTIADWIPRKNLEGLIRAFCQAFGPNDPVALVIKTLPTGQGRSSRHYVPVLQLFREVIQSVPGPQPRIVLMPDAWHTQQVDALHVLGDVYVSLSHGEGWGLGAFEAASSGKPVIAPAWGGWLDFLGPDGPGCVTHSVQPVPEWAGQTLFSPDQHWAVPDEAVAAACMRAFMHDRQPFLDHAQALMASIGLRYAPTRVVTDMLASLKAMAQTGEALSPALPRVSGVMLTEGALWPACQAIEDFERQHWPDKELIILSTSDAPELRSWLNHRGEGRHVHIRLVEPPDMPARSRSHAQLYQHALTLATGSHVALWDSSARHDPQRLPSSMRALQKRGAHAVWLGHVELWRPALGRSVRLNGNPCLSTMVAQIDQLPVLDPVDPQPLDTWHTTLVAQGQAIALTGPRLQVRVDEGADATMQPEHWDSIEQAYRQTSDEGLDHAWLASTFRHRLAGLNRARVTEPAADTAWRRQVDCLVSHDGRRSTRKLSLQTQEVLSLTQAPKARVSCLMVSRGELSRAQFAVSCFLRQTWPSKELVVVTQNHDSSLVQWLRANPDPRIRLYLAPQDLTLGELRNLSVECAEGEFVIQWDDDDLSDPQRITACMGVLQRCQVDLVLMSRWLQWWPARRRLAASSRRAWEGSMLARKSVMQPYPRLAKGEDTDVMSRLLSANSSAIIDWPELYLYTVTGHNTWHEGHFDKHWQHASWRAQGGVYDDLMHLLNQRMPADDYGQALVSDVRPRWRKVVQYVSSLCGGDGVSQSVQYMDRLLRRAGYETAIHQGCLQKAPHWLPCSDSGEALSMTPEPDTLLLVHFSLGDGYLHFLSHYRGAVGLYFHNVTPAELLPPQQDNPTLHRLRALGEHQLEQFKGRWCAVMAASRYSAQTLVGGHGYAHADVLPALVDVAQWQSRLQQAARPVPGLANLPFVLQVSRLMPHKGQMAAVDVLHTLHQLQGKVAHLVLVGDDAQVSYVHVLRERIQSLGLQAHVHVLGKVDEETLVWLYQHARAYLCMSQHEGFGMPLLEATLAGCPVVALDNSAKQEALGGAGHLVSAWPPHDLATRAASALASVWQQRAAGHVSPAVPRDDSALLQRLQRILLAASPSPGGLKAGT